MDWAKVEHLAETLYHSFKAANYSSSIVEYVAIMGLLIPQEKISEMMEIAIQAAKDGLPEKQAKERISEYMDEIEQ